MLLRVVAAAVAVVVATAHGAEATERLVYRIPAVGQVTALAEDPAGALWMGTDAGLHRYDGRQWVQVARENIEGRITSIVPFAQDLIVAEEYAEAWLVTGNAPPRALVGENGQRLIGPLGIAVDKDQVWVVGATGVHVGRPLDLRRLPVPTELVAEVPRVVSIAASDSAYIATRRGLWLVDVTGRAERLTDVTPPARMLRDGDGVLHLAWNGTLSRWCNGKLERLLVPEQALGAYHRGIALARRGDTLWVAYDRALVALRDDRLAEVLRAAQDIPSGGPLLVDREGSLWLGTFRGLRQFPEPDTVAYAEVDGFPSNHGRFATISAEGVWLTTWQGTALLRPDATQAEPVEPPRDQSRAPLCPDGAGRLWGGSGAAFVVRESGRNRSMPIPDGGTRYLDCFTAGAEAWLATDRGVFVVDGDSVEPVLAGHPPVDREGHHSAEQIAIDTRGRLSISQGARVCSVPRDRAMVVTSWICTEEAAGIERVSDLWPTPTGAVWIAARPHGVYRLGHEGFERLGAVAQLPSPVVLTLTPSPRGGVWIAASGATLRVEEAPDTSDGWRVVERLGAWHGLMSTGVSHVAETEQGDLWMASSAGLIKMPAVARAGVIPAPAARITEVLTNGRSLDPDIAATLPAGDQPLQLRFAAASLRAPDLVRYRVQIGDGAWSPSRSGADLQLLDLRPGTWRIGVAASLDGERWGEVDRFELFVPTPWYLRTVVWLLGAAVFVALLVVVHRALVAVRLNFERQRQRIAMDLHDELGSGLGSIGVLAGVASIDSGSDTQREAVATIANTAADLGASLRDLVWSLRQEAMTLDQLARHLSARAHAMFIAGDVELVLPDPVPPAKLSPAVARALQLIGQEALHNASRHARAHHVELSLRRVGERRWVLAVDDDGVGLPDSLENHGDHGMGIISMQRRARAIGAALQIGVGQSGRGTRVELAFRTDVIDVRIVDVASSR